MADRKAPWAALGKKRLVSILGKHGIACVRTLEQKISGAGPYGQRVQPHILTPALNQLVRRDEVQTLKAGKNKIDWYFLPDAEDVQDRLDEQLPVYNDLNKGDIHKRIGQCLEIAIFKSLCQQNSLDFLGHFHELDKHDDGKLYSKEEPPRSLSGKSIGKQSLDFIIEDKNGIHAGLEAKNVRQWLYPYHTEVLELLKKTLILDCVPILVARKFPPITIPILTSCGVVLHETYYQLLPEADSKLAEKAKDKNLLGYHDIRIGNEPDKRMKTFIETNLPDVLPEARNRFEKHKDLIKNYLERVEAATIFTETAEAFEDFARALRVDVDDYHGPPLDF